MRHNIDPTIKTRLLLRPIQSPIGTLRLGGVNQGSFGVGRMPGPPRTLGCYGFAYILNGSGTYQGSGPEITPLGKGDVVLFFPQHAHRCGTAPGKFWDELWFEFEGPVFDLMRDTGLLHPDRPVQATQNFDYLYRKLFAIIPPVHLHQKVPPQVIVSRFSSLLIEILSSSETSEEPSPARDDWLTAACGLLSDHDHGDPPQPAAVAHKLGFSYETFRKKFREAVGFSPGQFRLDARIDRAAALLHQGRHTIKEIAEQMNFCDEFYFSRCFKRRFGQSPRAFRRQVRGV